MEEVTLLAHVEHSFRDYEFHRDYRIAEGHAMAVPDELGRHVANVHRNKLCVLGPDETIEDHDLGCKLAKRLAKARETALKEADTMLPEPDEDRAMVGRMSPGRRRKLKDARRRSRRARLATADIP